MLPQNTFDDLFDLASLCEFVRIKSARKAHLIRTLYMESFVASINLMQASCEICRIEFIIY